MKKLLYILALSLVLATSFTACTEEAVEPVTNETPGGGGTDPKG